MQFAVIDCSRENLIIHFFFYSYFCASLGAVLGRGTEGKEAPRTGARNGARLLLSLSSVATLNLDSA